MSLPAPVTVTLVPLVVELPPVAVPMSWLFQPPGVLVGVAVLPGTGVAVGVFVAAVVGVAVGVFVTAVVGVYRLLGRRCVVDAGVGAAADERRALAGWEAKVVHLAGFHIDDTAGLRRGCEHIDCASGGVEQYDRPGVILGRAAEGRPFPGVGGRIAHHQPDQVGAAGAAAAVADRGLDGGEERAGWIGLQRFQVDMVVGQAGAGALATVD